MEGWERVGGEDTGTVGSLIGRRPTAYDVARLAGVFQSMVSRASTPGGSVSPEAGAKVLEAARQLNYRPNLIARSLITQRSRLIGVAMAYMENQFYPTILEALSECFAAENYRGASSRSLPRPRQLPDHSPRSARRTGLRLP